jgi:hypothetical protein
MYFCQITVLFVSLLIFITKLVSYLTIENHHVFGFVISQKRLVEFGTNVFTSNKRV